MEQASAATILNLYSNQSETAGTKGDHGQSFFITVDGMNVLFDAGAKADVLLGNMEALGVDPESVDVLVCSHGHYDHTRALPDFLDARHDPEPLPIYMHPAALERKMLKIGPFRRDIGFPTLTEEQRRKLEFHLVKDPIPITEHLRTTGEILERPYRDGTEPTAYHEHGGLLEHDPIHGDLSLLLSGPQGAALICGCAHAAWHV